MNGEDKKIFDKYNEIINQTAEEEEFEHQKKALKKSAAPSLPRYTRVQEACQEECLGAPVL